MTRTFRPVYPIRALWEAASEDERRLAQERCTAILEYWLGVTSKEESAKRLNVPPIRLWQLSQRAVAGIVCALVKPPQKRTRTASSPLESESSPIGLKKEIARLKKDLDRRNHLIEVLKSLPSNQLSMTNRAEESGRGPDAVQRKKGPNPPKRDRKKARGAPPVSRTETDRGGSPGSDRADALELGT